MKKYIILLFALCFLSSCKPTVDYEIPSEVETMAISRFNKASGIFYEIQKTHGTTESPIIGSKNTLYISKPNIVLREHGKFSYMNTRRVEILMNI